MNPRMIGRRKFLMLFLHLLVGAGPAHAQTFGDVIPSMGQPGRWEPYVGF